jgi:nitroimidazol reductase NimA-like FMN-containing flavoprotein (pyridoxamine 5'-phosphate oxidase superfamily)
MDVDEPITRLGTEECWEFLRRHEFGRLAHHLADEVHLAPVNYAVDHDPATGRRSLLFRTAEGSKLLGVVLNGNVAFEVEEVGSDSARSVVVRGRARQLGEHEAHRAENVPLHTWVPGERYEVVEIRPMSMAGREYPLVRPWTHMHA